MTTEFGQQVEETKKKAKSVLKKVFWLALICSVLFSAGYYFYRNWTLSEGTRSGLLFKVSKKGKVFKTYEGQLHLGGVSVMTAESVWDFSVKDEETYKKVQALEGKLAKLTYKQVVDPFPWQGETDYLVTDAEAVEK